MIPEYHYRVRDYSIITPVFKKCVVAPLFRFIPWWLPANIITIFSNLLMYVALYLALFEYPERSLRFVLVSLLVIGYVIGDHLDGMQAKRTGTSSALGEFFDHYLDIFNNGILLYTVCLLFHIANPALIAFFLVAGYLPHTVIFYEQFSTKWLRFEKFGSLESVLILAACIMVSAIEPVYLLALNSPLSGFTLAETLFVLSSSGAFITFAQTVWRVRVTDVGFWVFCVSLIAIACMATIFLSPIAIFFVITVYSGIYIGNLQRGHLADCKKRFPDVVVPLFMAAAIVFEPLREPAFLWGLDLYLAFRTLWIAANAFGTLRKFWVWKNPKPLLHQKIS
jgi:ethanolaminephosphotransferase